MEESNESQRIAGRCLVNAFQLLLYGTIGVAILTEELSSFKKSRRPRQLPLGLKILHEDRDLLLVDKPGGLLTMASERERVKTAYYAMTDYVRKGSSKSRNRIFIVHRLDRDTSGVLIFAKSEEAKHRLQDRWEETRKVYLAVVHGRTPATADSIVSYLAENDAQRVYSTTDQSLGRLSRTDYKVLKRTQAFSLLEIHLYTGRKNQIRVHCAENGFPVVGDKKYGLDKDVHSRLALHAYQVEFPHPVTGKVVLCQSEVPKFFPQLLGPLGECLDKEQV